ncbi:MAG: hypothetical protein QOI58_1474 [Thermoanaerobaculia bacterium]|jgi:hypothetical protein|nr:hypothetical protein [Thermoanaerobaculia bacterium]
MALRFVLPLLAILGQTRSTQLRVDPHVLVVQTAAQSYKAGIAAADAKQWDQAAEDFRQAIARDPGERPGYFPHYWLGVAYDELHQTSNAFAEWRQSQRQGAIKGTPEEAAMRHRMSAHMQTAARPPVTIFHPPPHPLQPQPPTPPVPEAQPAPPPPVIPTATLPVEEIDILPTTTRTETAAMTTATTGTVTTTEHQHDPTTTEGQLWSDIDRRFRDLNPGELLISAPRQMRVAVPQSFVLRIAPVKENKGISSDLPTGGQTFTASIHLTPTMRATLAGTGFTIQSNSNEEQMIGGGSFTEWSWQVTPIESGNRDLVATVYVEIDGKVKGIAKRWPVHVSANAGRSFSQFVGSYWQWFLTTLIIPVVLFWRRQKQT